MSSPSIALSLLDLKTPTCEKGIGKVIVAPDSKDLILGVRAAPYSVWPDDRGYFLEGRPHGPKVWRNLFQRTPRRCRRL